MDINEYRFNKFIATSDMLQVSILEPSLFCSFISRIVDNSSVHCLTDTKNYSLESQHKVLPGLSTNKSHSSLLWMMFLFLYLI